MSYKYLLQERCIVAEDGQYIAELCDSATSDQGIELVRLANAALAAQQERNTMNQDQLRAAFDAWYDDTPILKPLYFNAFLAGAQAAQQSSAPAAQPVAGQTEREAFEAWSGHAPEDGEPMAWAAWQAALSQPKQPVGNSDELPSSFHENMELVIARLDLIAGNNSSDYREDAAQALVCARAALESRQEQPKQTEVWVTGDDTPIAIADMTEAHAKNALSMIVRRLSAGESVKVNAAGRLEFSTALVSRQEQSQGINLPEITDDDRELLHYNPNTSDLVDWAKQYATAAVELNRVPRQEQPVPDIDGCTEEYCNRCRTPKKWRTPDMKHAGIGSYPAAPKQQEGA